MFADAVVRLSFLWLFLVLLAVVVPFFFCHFFLFFGGWGGGVVLPEEVTQWQVPSKSFFEHKQKSVYKMFKIFHLVLHRFYHTTTIAGSP